MKQIGDIFNERKDNPLYNTSYPLSPADWRQYEAEGQLPFDPRPISFYLHIPFCTQSCSFCEYTRMRCPSEKVQHQYLDILENDVKHFLTVHRATVLEGCDIGGGTPTSLCDSTFARLMELYRYIIARTSQTGDYEPSIEATSGTLGFNRIRMIAEAGIKRVSIGIQTADRVILHNHKRNCSDPLISVCRTIERLRREGISKVNIDLMYGMRNQTFETVDSDIKAIRMLSPQQVTLYELRTNMNGYGFSMSKEDLFQMYGRYYDALVKMGYHAMFGQNTFSLDSNDKGVSSYLRHRMTEGSDYVGFGVSAQSMSRFGVSYNIHKGKVLTDIDLNASSYNSGRHYRLPPSELASKYIAISAYNGRFSLAKVSEILGEDARYHFRDVISFCTDNGLISVDGDTVNITHDGFKYYGAVFSLFYLPPHLLPSASNNKWDLFSLFLS